MARPAVLKVDILADAKGAKRGVAEAESSFGRLGKVGAATGAALASGATAGAVGLAYLGKQAYDSASTVQQSMGAIRSVFGDSAERVRRWARTAADSVGLARSEYARLSAVVGSQLQAMGRSQAQSATETRRLIRLGADLAATYGGSVSDAVAAVGSLLRGERDPIEQYGVAIKQSDINARLAAQGLDNLTGKALKQAEADATLALLTKQTANAQGQFARESNTAAGAQERLSAKVENVKARLGRALLPAATRVFNFLGNRAIPATLRLGRALDRKFGPAASRIAGFIKRRVVPAAQSFYSWFREKIYPAIVRFVRPQVDALRGAFNRIRRSVNRNKPELRALGRFLRRIAEIAARYLLPILGKVRAAGFAALGRAIATTVDQVARFIRYARTAAREARELYRTIRDSPVGSGLGNVGDFLNPFGAVGVSRMVSPTVGRGAGVSPGIGRLATASDGLATAAHGGGGAGMVSRGGLAGPSIVDRRTFRFDVRVEGALDPHAVADQVERILQDAAVRAGRVSAYRAGETAWGV